MSRILRTLAVVAPFFAFAPGAAAADRVALVIGNSAYKTQHVLANPVNDAADVSAMFRRLGFEVVEGTDLDGAGLKTKIKEFRDKLESGSLALFYYSGHGMQVDGHNYIIPVDAKIEKPEDIRFETVDMDLVLQVMRADERVAVVVLDACRDNPFARSLRRAGKPGTRAAESAYGGLAEIKSAVGSVIIYATDPGNVALDGDGRNSPFTEAFLKNAPQPGLEISRLIKRVRLDVVQATGSKQVPWDSSTLVNDVYLGGEGPAVAGISGTPGAAPITSAGLVVAARTPGEASPPTPAAVPAPIEPSATEQCDRLAGDIQDPARNKKFAPVRIVDTAKAVPICEKAVSEAPKDLHLANQLGRAYLKSERHADALRVFKDAASRGSAYASNEVGYLYFRGFGGAKKDYAQARPWFEKGAQLGVPVSMSNLAYMYAHGIGGERNLDKALALLRRGEALGDAGSIVSLADHHLEGLGTAKDEAKAKELLVRVAETQENPEAMTRLGLMAQRGQGGPQDFDGARRWFEKAAAYDSADGMYNLGFYYLMGQGGAPRDYAVARDWFTRSVRHEGVDAQIGLAHMAINGLGGPVDLDAARAHLDRAVAYDSPSAMVYYGRALRDGTLGKPDEAGARALFEKAAALDDATGKRELAEMIRPRGNGETCDRYAAIATDPLRPRDVAAVANIDAPRAIPACEAAVREAPATLRFADQLGLAYVQAERWADALRVFTAAAQKKSAFAALWVGNFHRRGLGIPADAVAARKWYEQASTLGSSDALFNLAVDWLDGHGGPKDAGKARAYFEKAAALGHIDAMREVGELWYFGKGVAEDNTKARQWYEKAAALDDAVSKRRLGEILLKGHGVKADPAAARLWFQRAAGDGDGEAMRQLADLYLNGLGGNREPRKARGLLEQAAEGGNARAMSALAQALLAGVVGDVDEDLARSWYEKAAAAGDKSAQTWVASHTPGAAPDIAKGDLCDQSAGSAVDPLRSVEFPAVERVDPKVAIPACEAAHAAAPDNLRWADQLGRAYLVGDRDLDAARVFRKAADDGSAFATLWMGNLHARGLAGLSVDPEKAAEWWTKAADLGSSNAMYNMGSHHLKLYEDGTDAATNAAAAKAWFERAAAVGEPDSMLQLAYIHKDAIGVPADTGRFLEWLRKASEFGNGDAMRVLASRLYNGDDGAADAAGARRLLARAVEAGNVDALGNLAFFLIEGLGGPKDLPQARKLLERGAARQNVDAIVRLAKAHEKGLFGKPDKPEARRWFRLAADLGNADAAKALDRLK